MSDNKKQELPFGWVVKHSKSYPDRVYYFNVNSGASTWEFPDLLSPLLCGKLTSPLLAPVLTSLDVQPATESGDTHADHRGSSPDSDLGSEKSADLSYLPLPQTMKNQVPKANLSKIQSRTTTTASSRYTPYQHKQKHTEDKRKSEITIKSDRDKKLDKSKSQTIVKQSAKLICDYSKGKETQKKVCISPIKYSTGSLKTLNSAEKQQLVERQKENKSNLSLPNVDKVSGKANMKVSTLTADRLNSEKNDGLIKTKNEPTAANVDKSVTSNAQDLRHKLKARRTINRESSNSKASLPDTKHVQGEKRPPNSPKSSNNTKKIKTETNTHINNTESLINTDKRKVVKSLHKIETEKRNIVLKKSPLNNFKKYGKSTTKSGKDLKVSKVVSKSCDADVSVKSECSFDSGNTNKHTEDGNNNEKVRLFIGDKDKLLSIQSWINDWGDESSLSDTPAREFYSVPVDSDLQGSRVVNESTDSGYITTPVRAMSPLVRSERGWPGKLKPSSIASREIVAMEIDDCELPESDGVGYQEEEKMDIDLVLSEVRQEVKLDTGGNRKCVGNLGRTMAQGKITESHTALCQQVHIVVDTNVLMSKLTFLDDLKDQDIKGLGKPVLYIPWVVLQELDVLKEKIKHGMPGLTLVTQSKARKAVTFLKALFTSGHPRIRGQTPKLSDEARLEFRSACNDDTILQACLQAQKRFTYVILLTNDNNLITKALVCGVKAYNSSDITDGLKNIKLKPSPATKTTSITILNTCIPEVKPSANYNTPDCKISERSMHTTPTANTPVPPSNTNIASPSIPQGGKCIAETIQPEKTCSMESLVDDMYCKMKSVLREAMGKVLEREMQIAYDDIWKEIVYRKPPWSLRDILDCWKKHWTAVFGMVFRRCLISNVDRLIANLYHTKTHTLSTVIDSSKDSDELLKECVARNLYGETMVQIKECIACIHDLSENIIKGHVTLQSVTSLEVYLKAKCHNSPAGFGNSALSRRSSISSQQSVSSSSRIRHPSHTDHSQSNVTQSTSQSGSQTNHTNIADTRIISSSNLNQSNSTQNIPEKQNQNNFNNQSTQSSTQNQSVPAEALAGETLQHIWQTIYKYCNQIGQALSSSVTPDTMKEIETLLTVLVPVAKDLRIQYVSILEIPPPQLIHHEDKFVVLCNLCNSFFTRLHIQDQVPNVPVTPTHFLMLYCNAEHRATLNQFREKLDEMLNHLYHCLQKICPDD